MQRFVDGGLKSGLNVILDYHDTDNKCSTSFDTCFNQLKRFWEQVSLQYKDYPDKVVFEVMNEPHEPLRPDVWNSAQRELLHIIRMTNPTRTVILSPMGFSSINKLRYLDMPDDKNILVTIHYYEPRAFTMQFKPSTSWSGKSSFRSWGTPTEIEALKTDFDVAKQWSVQHHVPIFVGEFGVWDAVPITYRAAYLHAVVGVAERNGFSWADWQYRHDFSATDPKTGAWLPPILRALVAR